MYQVEITNLDTIQKRFVAVCMLYNQLHVEQNRENNIIVGHCKDMWCCVENGACSISTVLLERRVDNVYVRLLNM